MSRPSASDLSRLAALAAVPASGAGPRQEVREAFTGELLGSVPTAGASDVAAAFDSARAAQQEWARVPARERATIFRRFADLVHERRDWLLDVVQAESGKNRLSALDEVLDVILNARFYAENGPLWLRTRRVGGMIPGLTRAKVVHEPRGVVGVIAPWNYPLSLAMTDALAALMAGNAVVMKPASLTPFSALAGLELWREAGLPANLWEVVPGRGAEVGGAILERCDYLMFTGSSETGAELAAQIGKRLIPYSAELGGKNPMIIGEGCDLERVAEIAVRACFASAGQLCMSIERIYAVGTAYEEFSRVFAARIRAMRLGAAYDWTTDMGCLVSADQLRTVGEHVHDAVAKGARVLAGGRARPDLGPSFYEPTLLAGVPPEATCYAAETFGPVVSIYPAASIEHAIELANASDYGLCSSVCCATDAEGEAVAERLRTGMANVNEGYAPAWSSLEGPSGGMGKSGVGYRHGKEGLLKYTQARTIAVQSRLLHLGGPDFVSKTAWPEVLARATNLMRHLPGR